MSIRKVLAGSMAAITAGATIAFGAFAQSTSLSDYVGGTSTAPAPPWVVIGANTQDPQFAKDVLGAADLAAATAGYVTVSKAVGGAAEVSVTSGGVSLSTANTKILGADPINVAKDTLTSEDLPVILASGTFEGDDEEYDYDQYIVVGHSTGPVVALSNSGGELDTPMLLVNIGEDVSYPAYTMRVVLNDDLNLSDTNEIEGNEIELFGSVYTVSSDTTTNKLVLFGGALKKTLSAGEEATLTVGGVSYVVNFIGCKSDGETIVVQVDTDTEDLVAGESDTVGGLELYVQKAFCFESDSGISSTATLSFGSAKMTLENGQEVTVGDDEDEIDNTAVSFTPGTGSGTISVMEVAVAAPSDDDDYAAVGHPFTDPVFGTFKLAFGGGFPAPDLDEPDFEFEAATDEDATVDFTDAKGNSETINFAYDSDADTSGTTLVLGDEDGSIIVLEGANVTEEDWVVINQDDFSHLLYVDEVDVDDDDEEGTIEMTDVFSGTTYEIALDQQSASSPLFNGTKVIDGKTYKFWAYDNGADDTMAIVWGTGSTVINSAVAGDVTTVFPTVVAAKDAKVAFLNNLSSSNGITQTMSGTFEILGIETVLSNTSNTELTGTSIRYTYENATTGFLTIESVSSPSVLVLEEEGEDPSGDDVQNAVIVSAGDDGDGVTVETGSTQPFFTDDIAQAASWLEDEAQDYIYLKGDRYGTLVVKDTDEQGAAKIYYPDTQTVMAVGIGEDPDFSVSGEGGTVQEAYKITSAVAKLASEVSTATLNRDVILVGGPCANSLVATLMDVETAYPACVAPFEGLSEGMVKEYTDAFGSGQKALVVAGYTADDTRALAGKVISGAISSYDYEA